MANIDAPFGLAPVATISGTNYKSAIVTVTGLVGYSTALFKGTPLKFGGSASPDGLYPSVELCAPGDDIDFVALGFTPDFDKEQLDTAGGPADTLRIIQAIPVFGVIFEVQASAATAITDIGSVVDLTAETGDAITGNSTVEVDSATYATGTAAQLRVLSVSPITGRSDITSDNVVLRVTVNQTNFAFDTNGV